MSFHAKKSLGQNFLNSTVAKKQIIAAGNIQLGDIILEIGPGKGAITEGILKKISDENKKLEVNVLENTPKSFYIGVEKDDALFEMLSEKFAEEIKTGICILFHGDILDSVIEERIFTLVGNRIYKIIANIPYYITGEIIRKFLSISHQPTDMVLLVQKEVAERIVGRSRGKEIGESILSASVKVYGTPTYIDTVKAKYFSPEPNVDSAILKISGISKKSFTDSGISEEKFFSVVKAGFKYKRKQLVGNLSEFGLPKEEVIKILLEMGYTEKARSEEISINCWLCLANLFQS